jgi:hypothetical protein
MTLVQGPKRVFGWGSAVEPLPLVTAEPSQFIRVVQLDGSKIHIPGPASIVFHPLEHKQVGFFFFLASVFGFRVRRHSLWLFFDFSRLLCLLFSGLSNNIWFSGCVSSYIFIF